MKYYKEITHSISMLWIIRGLWAWGDKSSCTQGVHVGDVNRPTLWSHREIHHSLLNSEINKEILQGSSAKQILQVSFPLNRSFVYSHCIKITHFVCILDLSILVSLAVRTEINQKHDNRNLALCMPKCSFEDENARVGAQLVLSCCNHFSPS